MSVYFITCREVNMVKIGYSDRVRARFCSVKVCCPIEARLELMLLGGKDEEQAIHKLLAKDRVRGEWFKITETVERFIQHPPPAPPEYPDLKHPFTDVAEHERLVKRMNQKRREQPFKPGSEIERRFVERVSKEMGRRAEQEEKIKELTLKRGSRELAKAELRGDVIFPFRQTEAA